MNININAVSTRRPTCCDSGADIIEKWTGFFSSTCVLRKNEQVIGNKWDT